MKISNLWNELEKEKFARIDDSFLSTFRQPGQANNRLAAWDPFDKSMRYFKFLLFHQIQLKDSKFFANYERIGSTALGNPVSLRTSSGLEINLDHFFSVEEFTFLNENMPLDGVDHILEIGAGFGRLAQALIKLVKGIRKYTIIDLPQILLLSALYLEKVLSKAEFQKINFVNALLFYESPNDFGPLDLVINIDSFQEMPGETVKFYFDRVIDSSRFFYTKNAIGKYAPETVGLYDIPLKQLREIYSLGRSTEVIDIFNSEDLENARQEHIYKYMPSTMPKVIAQEPLGIFPYYLNVLYGRNSN